MTPRTPATLPFDAAAAVAYALATNDPNPQYLSGQFAPPMFILPIESNTGSGEAIAEQFSTICVRGLAGSRAGGGSRDDAHAAPEPRPSSPTKE